MTKVDILQEPAEGGTLTYRAVAGRSSRSAGDALDALTAQLPADEAGTLIVVQRSRQDEFFTAGQQRRLSELMAEWRDARDRWVELPDELHTELEQLVDAELQASAQRARALLAKLAPCIRIIRSSR
jgi:hypothetical protein